jgi:hypothetical protein
MHYLHTLIVVTMLTLGAERVAASVSEVTCTSLHARERAEVIPRMLQNSIRDSAELSALCKAVVLSGNRECEKPIHSIGCSSTRALLKWQQQCKAPHIGNTRNVRRATSCSHFCRIYFNMMPERQKKIGDFKDIFILWSL